MEKFEIGCLTVDNCNTRTQNCVNGFCIDPCNDAAAVPAPPDCGDDAVCSYSGPVGNLVAVCVDNTGGMGESKALWAN